MNVEETFLSRKKDLATDYLKGNEKVLSLFDYTFTDQDMKKRKIELENRSYDREALVNYLKKFNGQFSDSKHTIPQIEKLLDKRTLAVVGGQQAGILTGPLYTIHKILTMLQVAKEQERKLGVSVVPIFWIAGEDHDFAEVNHLFIKKEKRFVKKQLDAKEEGRTSISQYHFDKSVIETWIREILQSFDETMYTKDVIELLNRTLHRSTSYVTFFGELISTLFKGTGLILLDSGDPEIRKLESSMFKQLIVHNQEVGQLFIQQSKEVQKLGYGTPIEINDNSSHLFYHPTKERILLERDHEGVFQGKQSGIQLTKDECLHIADNTPERLSNNVVTRGIMQEAILPVLAFVAGPGELAYWGTFKQLFHYFNFKVPPVVPRHTITFVERSINKYIKEFGLTVEMILNGETHLEKERWFKQQRQWDVSQVASIVKQEINESHKKLRNLATEIDPTLERLSIKNNDFLLQQVEFLEKQLEKKMREKYIPFLDKFDLIHSTITPIEHPQERIANIFYYLNSYGLNLMSELTNLELDINGKHKIIYL